MDSMQQKPNERVEIELLKEVSKMSKEPLRSSSVYKDRQKHIDNLLAFLGRLVEAGRIDPFVNCYDDDINLVIDELKKELNLPGAALSTKKERDD